MEARRIVGWNVRRIRVARGFTIEELADRAGLDASYVARIERAVVNPSIGVVEKLCRALGASLTELVREPARGAGPPRPLRGGRRAAR